MRIYCEWVTLYEKVLSYGTEKIGKFTNTLTMVVKTLAMTKPLVS